jgi:hypothetical protein
MKKRRGYTKYDEWCAIEGCEGSIKLKARVTIPKCLKMPEELITALFIPLNGCSSSGLQLDPKCIQSDFEAAINALKARRDSILSQL